ncbi:uncharacterized protein A4U43_C07F18150 [Asparagus officinalis]|uniref:Sulfite reductase [NADPH] flavoprotein alpha-component-like FAD-binding domain-containing protein n=1 Tax=Asparagus officinalis TaxID=4686 RepID=A0A5P1EET0_ASPOF|nr:uncharacterized protein A4U43_C07F18150 [Asparagus officinalis]
MRSATEDMVGNDAWRLYQYICQHFIGSVSPDCKYRRTNIEFTVGDEVFRCGSTSPPDYLSERAKRLVEVGLGDDDQCIEDASLHGASTTYTVVVPEYRVVFVDSEATSHLEKKWSLANGHVVHDIHHPYIVGTFPYAHGKKNSSTEYETGDHVGVYSENCIETVEEAEMLLGLSSNTFFSIHVDNEDGTPYNSGSLPPPFPSPCTLRTALA